MSNEPIPPRTAARSRAEQRRSEALQLAVKLLAAGTTSPVDILDVAKQFEHYLRNNDGSNLGKPAQQ